MKMMASYAKGILLAAFMTVGTSAVNAQEEGGNTEGAETKTYAPAAANDYWRGENVENTTETYIFNVGAKTFITDNTAKETEIENASVWTITADNNTYTFTTSENGLYMEKDWKGTWTAGVKSASEASKFNLKTGTTSDKGFAYKLYAKYTQVWSEKYKYFNVDNSKYTGANTESSYNDWLFISAAQKEAYTEYASLYNEAISLLGDERLDGQDALKQALESALDNTAASNYDKYGDDTTTLKNAITPAKKYIDDIPSGIHCIKPATADDAKVSAIYGMNGVRNSQLTKGINIVKMSDGSVKKVLVK